MLNPSAPQYKVWCLIRLIWTIVRVAQVMGQEAPLAKPNWIFSVVKVNLMWTFSRRVLHLRKANFSKLLHLILPTLSRALMSCCTLSCANWLHNIFVRALFTRDLLKVGCVIFWSWSGFSTKSSLSLKANLAINDTMTQFKVKAVPQ